MKVFTTNKQALRDYQILTTYEAGLILTGAEVKAIKAGQMNLKGTYITINEKQEPCLIGAQISLYKKAHLPDYNPQRTRKLLLHKKEIQSLTQKLKQKGLTLVPLKVYNKNGLLKLEFGLAKGKKKWDKRQSIKKKEASRKIDRALKNY